MGLREVKKQRTHQEIADKGFELFAARGFERVTVAEIAEAAGVSEKTVFNYFPTKEDIFFDEVDEREAAFLEAIRSRKPGETVTAALRKMQLENSGRLSMPGFATFARIIEESPALRAKELEVMARFSRTLTTALEQELGLNELDARVAATLLIGIHWQFFLLARSRALAGRHGPGAARALRRDLARAYDLLEHGLGQLG
jgi:AcrR family transcriptional regulator